jgi:hypothetical protein
MNSRTTILLFVAVLTLGALILGIERYFPSAVQLREMRRGPTRVDREKVNLVEITDQNGTITTLKKSGKNWQAGEDLADPQKVALLIEALDAVEWVERVNREEFDAKEWAKTGLDKPRHKVRLLAGTSVVHECWFGSASVIEGNFYIGMPQTGDQASAGMAWYVARTLAPSLLQLPAVAWRDSKLVRVPTEWINRVTLTQAGGQIELFRESEHLPWVLLRPLKTRASKERVNEVLSALLNIEIIDAKEPAATGATKSEAQRPAADELKAHIETNEKGPTYDLTIKKPATDKDTSTTATTSHRKQVFTVSTKDLARLWVEPNVLRDHMLAQINADALKTITITSLSFPKVQLRNEEGSWLLERHGKWESANGERLARMLNALNTHEIVEFSADTAADLAPYGLDKPFQTISWTYPQFKPITLLFGANADSTKFYAKYENEPFVYRIDPSLLPSLPPDGIKWKGLGALRFSTFALRRITLSLGAAAPLVMNHDAATAQWTATRAGKDITEEIDRAKADRMAGMLAKFSVQDWSASRSDALQALKTPYLRIQILLGEAGRTDGPVKETNLVFSPTQPNADTAFFYGQVEGDPDIFYVSRKSLLEVVTSPLRDRAVRGK